MAHLDAILKWLDLGMGAACLWILVHQRIPQRVTRLEKHTGLDDRHLRAA